MTDHPTDPNQGTPPDLRKPAEPTPGGPGPSMWQPLDGSVPQAEPRPLTFNRPDAAGAADPAAGAWGAPGWTSPAPATQPLGSDPYAGRAVFVLAGWWRRCGAVIIDNVIVTVAVLIVTVPLGIAVGMTAEEALRFFSYQGAVPAGVAKGPMYVALVVQALISFSLPALFLAAWNGQTPGKRAFGLRVVRADGEPMTLRIAVRREVIGRGLILSVLGVVTVGIAIAANYLWPLTDDQNRAGHDRLADTRVVRETPGA